MNKELEALVRQAAILVQQKFTTEQFMVPYFLARKGNGRRLIFDPYGEGLISSYGNIEKTAVSGAAEMLFAYYKVERYVYACEAWMIATEFGATKEDVKKAVRRGKLFKHPKRVEIIIYEAEDYYGNKIAARQSIIRPAGYPPYLDDDLLLEDASEWQSTGRFTNLLAFRKFTEDKQNAKDDKQTS